MPAIITRTGHLTFNLKSHWIVLTAASFQLQPAAAWMGCAGREEIAPSKGSVRKWKPATGESELGREIRLKVLGKRAVSLYPGRGRAAPSLPAARLPPDTSRGRGSSKAEEQVSTICSRSSLTALALGKDVVPLWSQLCKITSVNGRGEAACGEQCICSQLIQKKSFVLLILVMLSYAY